MASYAVESESRENFAGWLGLVATLAALALGTAFEHFHLQPPWWLDTPAVMGFYGLVLTAYAKWLWRFRIFGIQLSRTPVLAGTWFGKIVSSHAPDVEIPALMHIEQDWVNMVIRLETKGSNSVSRSISINSESTAIVAVEYTFFNQPKIFSGAKMHPHRGAAMLIRSVDCQKLSGEYFSDQNRGLFGTMDLLRISDEVIEWEKAEGDYNKKITVAVPDVKP